MRILDRYIVREVSRHAFLGLIVFTFVFLVPRLVRLMEIYVRHVGSGGQILKLFLCIFPGVFVFTLPMATLIGVLLGLGRMSADSEIIARAGTYRLMLLPAWAGVEFRPEPRPVAEIRRERGGGVKGVA